VAQRRVGGDARAQQRRGDVEPQVVGDAHDEVLVDDDVRGVPALGDGAVAIDRAVGQHGAGQAILLVSAAAVLALAARVDHAADADAVADRVVGHLRADRADDAGDLVAGNGRVGHLAPLTAAMVDVGVADAAELDVDQDVTGTDVAPVDGQRDERLAGGRGAVGLRGARLRWCGLRRQVGHDHQGKHRSRRTESPCHSGY
jgi:hypothetical protein